MLTTRVLRSALAGLLALAAAACAQPAETAAPSPAEAVATAPAPRPTAVIPPDAPPEPKPRPRELLRIVTAAGPKDFQVEVVSTVADRAQGLMFRRSMAPDHGMLFDFEREQPVMFWMKNTYIPLDMIFVSADGTIAAIASKTIPLDESPVGPGVPVQAVLELNAGRAEALGVRPGDKVEHRIFGR